MFTEFFIGKSQIQIQQYLRSKNATLIKMTPKTVQTGHGAVEGWEVRYVIVNP